MKSRSKYSAINIAAGVGGQIVEMILRIVNRTIFIKCLSTEYLGVNSLFSEIITMLSLAELGIGSAISFALYQPLREDDKPKISALMQLYKKAYTYIGIAIGLVGLLLIPFLDKIVKDPGVLKGQVAFIYLFFLFNTVQSYFLTYKSTLLVADQKNFIVRGAKELFAIARTAIQIPVLIFTKNFYLYLAIESIMLFVNNFVVLKYVDKKYAYINDKRSRGSLDKATKSSIWTNIRALFLVKVSALLVNSTDNTIISIIGGIKEVGFYSNYSLLLNTATVLINQIFGNISSSVGNLNAEGDLNKSYRVFKAIHMANFWLYSWLSVGFIVMANPVIELWIGREYQLPYHVVIIVALNAYIIGLQNAVWVFKDTFGLFRFGKYMSLVTATLNIALSFGLGKLWGLFGVLAASAICRLLTGVWYDPYALYKHGFKRKDIFLYYGEYFLYFLLFCGSYFATFFICKQVHCQNYILQTAFQFIVACIIPNIIYLLVFFKTSTFKYMLEMIKNTVQQFFTGKKHEKSSSGI